MPSNWLLSGLPSPEWEALRASLEPMRLDARQVLVRAGDHLEYVYFPETGLVSLVVTMASGASAEVAVVGYEGLLGVSVLLEADPPPYDMVCQIPGRAARMPSHTFVRLKTELPTFHRRLSRYALALWNHVCRTAACNGVHSVEQRLTRWLLLCRDRVEDQSLPLTHETLAQVLSVRRPFITRTAAALQEAGLIHYTRGTIRITDSAGLETITCEDYRATEEQYETLLGWRAQQR